MMRIYLDTNIYIIGLKYGSSSSARILKEINKRGLHVTQSDYLYDEVLAYFRRTGGKDEAGRVREYLLTIPNNEIIDKYSWSMYIDRYRDLVADVDDIPHICCYIANDCDHFITTNRRLTKMKIGDEVNFLDPDRFLQELGIMD